VAGEVKGLMLDRAERMYIERMEQFQVNIKETPDAAMPIEEL
jgi:hypothetical protein